MGIYDKFTLVASLQIGNLHVALIDNTSPLFVRGFVCVVVWHEFSHLAAFRLVRNNHLGLYKSDLAKADFSSIAVYPGMSFTNNMTDHEIAGCIVGSPRLQRYISKCPRMLSIT